MSASSTQLSSNAEAKIMNGTSSSDPQLQKLQALTVTARNRAEVFERVLRVVRHRGFRVQKMQAEVGAGTGQVTLHLTLDSERSLSFLLPQLIKLPDVLSAVPV